MKIELYMGPACIKSAAHRKYESLLRECLKRNKAENPDSMHAMEQDIETLKEFLEQADFAALRAAHPVLAGACAGKARLKAGSPEGFIIILDNGQVLHV